MHSMIQFYLASSEGQISESSAHLYGEILERTFTQLEKDYGVQMMEGEIRGLDARTLQAWVNALKKTLKPSTINSYIVALNRFLHWASTMDSEVDEEIVPYTKRDFSNVFKTLPLPDIDELPSEERPKDKYYTPEQVHELM